MPDAVTFDDLLHAIGEGVGDGRFDELLDAMTARLAKFGNTMKWKITFGDIVVTEDDITMGEARTVEKITGQSWRYIDPHSSADAAMAILVARISSRDGIDLKTAGEKIAAAGMAQVVRGLGQYEAGPPFQLDSPTA